MQNIYDLKRYAILYVDDEEMALKYFDKSFGSEFRIYTAKSAADGLKIIEEHGEEIGVVLSDQRMPGQKGVQFLEQVRLRHPRIVRIMVTAYADFGVTVDAVNIGSIFRYVSKPLQVEDMRNTLHRAMEFFLLQQERDDLLREKLSVLQNILTTDRVISLGVLAAGLQQHFRNPLAAVQSFLDLAPSNTGLSQLDLSRLRDPAFWRDFHGIVLQQAGRIADLVGDLAAAGEGGQTIDVDAVLKAAVARNLPAFQSKGVHLQFTPEGPLPVLQGSAELFGKLIDLLLTVELDVAPAGTNAILVAGPGADAGLKLSLVDNGPGIPAASLRSVFDPFAISTEGSPNAGIYLMAAYLLVHNQGGLVSATRGGKGVNLAIQLPAAPSAPLGAASSTRDFVTHVLMNDTLWERLLPNG